MLGDVISGALPAMRAQAESLMVDACVIDRPTGETLNETTGQMVPTFADVYTGKCRLQDVGTQAGSPNAGEHQFVVVGHVVQLPIDATVYEIGDRVRMTVVTLDPALVGHPFTVTSLATKSHATMRRLICEEVIA
jgi:hypothetical protein